MEPSGWMEQSEIDDIKRDIIKFRSTSRKYKDKKYNWIVDEDTRIRFVNDYIVWSGKTEAPFYTIYSMFYTVMSALWKEPGYWGLHGVEGMNQNAG